MVARTVSVFRGSVWLGAGADEVGAQRMAFTPARWLERSFDAAEAGAPRFVVVRHRCQHSSLDYVAFLGVSYRPGAPGQLRLRVGVGDRAAIEEIQAHEAGVVCEALAASIEAWPECPAGEIVLDHARMHPVDTQDWAWRAAARLAADLLRPGAEGLDDGEIRGLGERYLRDRG